MAMIGAIFISEYPDSPAKSFNILTSASPAPGFISAVSSVFLPGPTQIIARHSSDAVLRIMGSSSQRLSNRLNREMITPRTCLQSGGIHKKACRSPTGTEYWYTQLNAELDGDCAMELRTQTSIEKVESEYKSTFKKVLFISQEYLAIFKI